RCAGGSGCQRQCPQLLQGRLWLLGARAGQRHQVATSHRSSAATPAHVADASKNLLASAGGVSVQTSIVDWLSGPLCDAVTGQQNGCTRLALLERGNYFVVPLDDCCPAWIAPGVGGGRCAVCRGGEERRCGRSGQRSRFPAR